MSSHIKNLGSYRHQKVDPKVRVLQIAIKGFGYIAQGVARPQ